MAGKTIHAAGGIVVVRNGARPKIAVVQRAKDELWVLPRGKLKRKESAVVGARREVVEETGHRVRVQEFLGVITYRARGRPKVVQFWRMRAERNASRKVMKDIVAVDWLPLSAAIRRLSYPLEKLFLRNVGRAALRRRKARARRKARLPSKPKSRSHGPKSRPHKQRLQRAATAGARGRNLSSRTMSRARANILRRVLGRLSQ